MKIENDQKSQFSLCDDISGTESRIKINEKAFQKARIRAFNSLLSFILTVDQKLIILAV